jgi:hypothetical protein
MLLLSDLQSGINNIFIQKGEIGVSETNPLNMGLVGETSTFYLLFLDKAAKVRTVHAFRIVLLNM